jgi:DNA modification methylase
MSNEKIIPDNRNYRIHGQRNKELIKKSVNDLGAGRSILIDNSGKIIAGNGVFEQWGGRPIRLIETDGSELVVVKRNDLSPDDPRRQQLAFADNHTSDSSEFDEVLLKEDWDLLNLSDWDFEFSLDSIVSDDDKKTQAKETLNERFIIPPFSILDSRQGYWQERKNAWVNLGIRSELGGRDKMKVSGSFAGSIPRYYELKEKTESKLGIKLSNTEFEERYLFQLLPKDSNIAQTETGGILSIFDPVLTEVCYKWFCPEKGAIIDPFAGGSVRGVVASYLGYRYTGVDLRQEQVEANIAQATNINPNNLPNWIIGNSLNIKDIAPGEYDFVFSCPPYFDLEVYSDDPADLSNMDWNGFKDEYKKIIQRTLSLLKENRFACFVVGDVRDEKGFYRNFTNYTIECFHDAGAALYNEIVLINVAGTLPVRVGRQFSSSRKVGKCHQNVYVFFKGDPKTIKTNFPEIEVSDLNI